MGKERRIVYIDLIKIIAAFLVIYTHTSKMGAKLYIYGDYGFIKNTIYIAMDIFRTMNVPLFFMVSGALLLGKEESYSQIIKKYVIKYILIVVSISYFYYTVYLENNWYDFGDFFKEVYSCSVVGMFWFFYTYIGFLLILPFLRKMVRNMTSEDYRYLLVLGVIFKGATEALGQYFLGVNFGIPCYLVADSIFYPIMGYYFANIREEVWKKRYIISGAILSVGSVACAVALTYWSKNKYGEFGEPYHFSFTLIWTLYSFCILKLIGTKLAKCQVIAKFVNILGSCSMGVYMFGLYIQVEFRQIYWNIYADLPNSPLLSCFIYVGVVVLLAVGITYILKKVPVIKRLL